MFDDLSINGQCSVCWKMNCIIHEEGQNQTKEEKQKPEGKKPSKEVVLLLA